jgi:hypothetical protein
VFDRRGKNVYNFELVDDLPLEEYQKLQDELKSKGMLKASNVPYPVETSESGTQDKASTPKAPFQPE